MLTVPLTVCVAGKLVTATDWVAGKLVTLTGNVEAPRLPTFTVPVTPIGWLTTLTGAEP